MITLHWKPRARILRWPGLCLGAVVMSYFGVLSYPQPAFAYHTSYRQFDVWSDRPIDAGISTVLDDATRRMSTSELYSSDQKFRVFFCNATWRLGLYALFQTKVGGMVYSWLTPNIYIRNSVIAENRIVSPRKGPMRDAAHRPLSYFIAHEATHVMQARAFGRFYLPFYPTWLNEGYADYVGKAGDFDIADNIRLLKANDPALDYQQSRLYRGYHLDVAWLMDTCGMSIRSIYAHPPSEKEIIKVLKTENPNCALARTN
ncbi:hypothetical protein [Acetobacter farinalis]|uniref:hypothetical protein n=1 Tax=Acetobacter farinalis TaxID=1260984 RepID=UPI00224526D3|nr:hypothetical protein [Acetobacter farinalis]